jgi:hypothetical protein
MKIKYNSNSKALLLLPFLMTNLYMPIIAQEKLANTIIITQPTFTIKSKDTHFGEDFSNLHFYNKNKYIKIKITGKDVNKYFIKENMKVVIIDSTSKEKYMDCFGMGNKAISDKPLSKHQMKKAENHPVTFDKGLKLIYKNDSTIIIKRALKYVLSNSVSTAEYGYALIPGNYKMYIKYTPGNNSRLSNKVDLIVK